MKILHITEALGGGVLNLISQLACSQSNAGIEVIIAHSSREDTPLEEELNRLFPEPIERVTLSLVTNISFKKDFLGLLSLLSLIKKLEPDVIHLHSSKAGVLGRIAGRVLGVHARVLYSPHGFSFLKEDVPKSKQSLYLFIERLLAFFGGILIASSSSEKNLATHKIYHKKVRLIENSIPLEHVLKKDVTFRNDITVVTSARICYAKAPSRFRDVALSTPNPLVKFYWIGDGELRSDLMINDALPPNLTISGWRKRDDVFRDLSRADIFLLLSRWEGMPLSLIEAQASGLPAIVLNVPGCRDVVENGVTGFICNSIDEVKEKLTLLIANKQLRLQMGGNAAQNSQKRFSLKRMNSELLQLYKEIKDNAL